MAPEKEAPQPEEFELDQTQRPLPDEAIPVVEGEPVQPEHPASARSLVNGKSFVNGQSLVNGKDSVNGKGLVRGVGLVNGKSLINGNGPVYGKGLVNGNGLVNGKSLINGNGLVNGRDPTSGPELEYFRNRGRGRRNRLAVITAAILVIVLVLPALFMLVERGRPPIVIDGSFDDWEGRPTAWRSTESIAGNPSIALSTVRLASWDGHFAFELETRGRILAGSPAEGGLDSFLLLLDSDRETATGFIVGGMGADLLVEVSGMDNRASSVTLSKFESTRSQHDWNGWIPTGTGLASARDDRLECKFSVNLPTDPLAIIYSFDPAGNSGGTGRALCTGQFASVQVVPQAPLITIPGKVIPLANLTFDVSSDTALTSLTVQLDTTHLDGMPLEVRLHLDDGLEGLSAGDLFLASSNRTGPTFEFQLPARIPLQERSPKTFWISVVAPDACCTMGLERVKPVFEHSGWPVAIQRLPPSYGWEEKATVGIPADIEIDGAFADWSRLPSKGRLLQDPEGDVEGGDDQDIDLVRASGFLDATSLDLSARVRGTSLAGTVIPFEARRSAQSGTVPGPSGPAPAPTPRIGTDRAEFFISSGADKGYRPEWLPAASQYVLAVEGRNGKVISSMLERFAGKSADQWSWETVSEVAAAAGGPNLEASIPAPLLPDIGENYTVFIRTTDWNRSRQETASLGTKPYLQFAIATFDPLEGLPALPPAYVTEEASGYFVVQLDRPVTDVFLNAAEAIGAVALDFIPTFGVVVHLPSNDPAKLERLEHVRWVGIHQPAFRLDPELLGRTGTLSLKVSTYQRPAEVALRMTLAGATVKDPPGSVVKVEADAAILPSIAAIPDLKFIEPAATADIQNDIARWLTNVNMTNTVYGLTGKGQIIAIADSGLDTGNDSDNQPDNPDFTGRVVKWYDVVKNTTGGAGDYTDDRNGHGTHVSGTAVGSGTNSNGQFRGVAPEADIVFQACGDDTGSTSIYIYSDITDLYSGPYNDGARVHSNSWGYSDSSYFGEYVTDCEYTDDFVWGNKSMLIVFAAGNEGSSGSGDANTTTPPGTAKNVLTVGASENNRPSMNSRGDNVSEIADFSSRGGTLDGRIKPDIVAPGTWIVSSWSSVALSSGWGIHDLSYIWMGGTSQATPHVSGAALLARQYFVDYENIEPSAALLKATLINGADDLGTSDIPNMNEGWGRLNLTNSLFPESPRVMRFIDNNTGFNSSDSPLLLNYTIGATNVPLKLTLVWSDFPGSPSANQSAPKLVNDLDVTLTAPNGSKYKGNVYSAGWSTTGGSADRLNNIECVYLKSPPAGTYTVNITPASITSGSQPFALVVSGELVPDLNITNMSIEPANAKPGDNIYVNATIVNCGSENLPPLFKESFSGLDPNISERITDVAFSPAGDFALLVGSNRTVVKYNTSTGTFTTLDTGTSPWTDFEGVAFNPRNHPKDRSIPEALLVGTNGTIVDFDGTGFTNVTGPGQNETLLDVAWNDNGTKAILIGKDGKVYSFPETSTVFFDDFESGDGNWAIGKKTIWANVTDQYASYDHSMHEKKGGGTHDLYYYLYLENSLDLSGGDLRSAELTFQSMYYTPKNNWGRSYCRLFATTDDSSLSNYRLRGFYFSDTSNTIGWTKETVDLFGYYPTTTFNVLFDVFFSSTSVAAGEWWIDDVCINKTVYAATSVTTLDSSAVLRGVQFVPGTDNAVMVGDGGIAWKYAGGALSALSSGTASDLRALSFKPQNRTCIIVGDNGTVLRHDAAANSTGSLAFQDSNVSFWDVAYRQGFSVSGPKSDCSQALLVGAGGAAWQYFGYDDHFNNVSINETRTFYGVAFNNTRYPLYGPALLVGFGPGPVVQKDTPARTFRPFLVDFYADNSSYSSNWLGRVQVDGGLEPDPYHTWGTNRTVCFLWIGAPNGSYNITVRVDITSNESSPPPSPDRINEVEEWTNNQLSMDLLLVPEFGAVLYPMLVTVAVFILSRRARMPIRMGHLRSHLAFRRPP